jgi:hypothetical protein
MPAARPGFSMSELVSEEALPDWLRQASAESAQPTQRQPVPGTPGAPAYPSQQGYPPAYPPANQPPAPGYNTYNNGNGGYGGYAPAPAGEPPLQRPDASAFPSLESAGSYQAPLAGGGGMPASSLLDPNALPTWLGGQQGQAASDVMRGGEGMRAQSLVDDAALPGWLRNEPASPVQMPAAAPPPAAPGWGEYPAPGASVAPVVPGIAPNGYARMQPPAAPPRNGQAGFSASQLIDPAALPGWMQAQGQAAGGAGAGVAQPAAAPAAQPGWSASDLIDPSMLPGWVRGNEAAAPGAGAAYPGMSAMPSAESNLARERTSRVPAPREANPTAERDFGASRAGTSHRGAVSRKHQAAHPLGENEKPAWLREDSTSGFGYDDQEPGRQGRGDNGRNGYNGYDDYGDNGAQNGRNGQRGQRGRMPAGQTGQSWATRDGRETSRRGRQQPPRQQAAPTPKKRKGGFFGFLRRG